MKGRAKHIRTLREEISIIGGVDSVYSACIGHEKFEIVRNRFNKAMIMHQVDPEIFTYIAYEQDIGRIMWFKMGRDTLLKKLTDMYIELMEVMVTLVKMGEVRV